MDDANPEDLNNPFLSPAPPPDAALGGEGPKSWPLIIGVIAIVFGSFAALGGCGNIVSTLFFTDLMGELMEGTPQGAIVLEQLETYKPLIVGLGVAVMVLALWLLVAGIGMIRRARWSVPAALTWSIAKMILVVANGVISYQMQQAQMKAFADVPDAMDMQPFGPGMNAFFILLSIAWGWALPVFVLVWFSRPAVRQEVATW